MKKYVQKVMVIALLLCMVFALHVTYRDRNSAPTTGTVMQVEQRSCRFSILSGCTDTFVRMSYKDGEIDREIDIKYYTIPRRGRLATPVVGLQVPIMYVPDRPSLSYLAVNHVEGWLRVAALATLMFVTWMAWTGRLSPRRD
jgi:hypothetical protein